MFTSVGGREGVVDGVFMRMGHLKLFPVAQCFGFINNAEHWSTNVSGYD